MNIHMAIGDRIRRNRSMAGLTQEGLAEIMGVTPQTVSRWECGKSNRISVERLYKLSKVLDVSVASLLPEQTEHMCKE